MADLDEFANLATSIESNAKDKALLKALERHFSSYPLHFLTGFCQSPEE